MPLLVYLKAFVLAGRTASSFVQASLGCYDYRQIYVKIQLQRNIESDVDEILENNQLVLDGQRCGRWNLQEQLVEARLTAHHILALDRLEMLLYAVVSVLCHEHFCAVKCGPRCDGRAGLVHGHQIQTNLLSRVVAFSGQRRIDLHESLIDVADLFERRFERRKKQLAFRSPAKALALSTLRTSFSASVPVGSQRFVRIGAATQMMNGSVRKSGGNFTSSDMFASCKTKRCVRGQW